jgi:hypothetical protein
MINVAVLAMMFLALQLTLGISERGNTYMTDLREQQFQLLALDEIASEMVLLLEISIYRQESKHVALLLSKSEDLQFAFSNFRDVALRLNMVDDLSFATEAEPTVYALRNDVVRCVSLIRKEQYDEAARHFDRVIKLRMAPIERFVESSRYAKDLQIATEQEHLDQTLTAIRIGVVTTCFLLVALV